MLRIDSLYQTFNEGQVSEVQALRGVDLHLPPCQFVTVIGGNGAGKSTLFNAVAGVYPPTRGRIVIGDVDVSTWSEHKRASLIGRVFQDPLMGTAASMTIAQNLTLALLRDRRLQLRTGVTRERIARFREVLAPLGLGLEDRLDERVAQLSGGQRQALTLLMATMARPKILLLDEHTAALDPATAAKIVEMTKEIVEHEQLTTLMITHNMQQALTTGDRTLMMDEGQIVLDLTEAEQEDMSVQDLVALFTKVRSKQLEEDKLLLTS